MVDVPGMWKILERDYGISTLEELETALASSKGVDISIFTERKWKDDSARVSHEDQRRITA